MRIVKPFATAALVLGLGLSAWVALADSNDGAYQRNSQVRQAVANDAGEAADDLVLPELDKPASLKQNKSYSDNGDRNYAAPRTGSVSRQSQVRQASGELPADSRHPAVDSLSPDGNEPDAPQAAPHTRRARPAPRNTNQPPADYAPAQRGNYQQAPDNHTGRTTSGYTVTPGPQPAPYTNKYSPNYRPAYAESAAPASNSRAAYSDRVAQAPRPYPASGMQSQSASDYRPGARFAARYEPTPAAPDGGPPSAASAPMAPPEEVPSGEATNPWESPEGGCPDCGQECGGCNGCRLWQPGGWFAGAEYLLLRPTSSENIAYQKIVSATDNISTTTDTAVQRDWDYQSSVRAFIGYRTCDCCGEIRFTYWNYNNSTHQVTDPVPQDSSITYNGQLEIDALTPGQVMIVNNSLSMNTYDIEYSKCLTYGGCCPCECPPWGLKYYAGVRIASVDRGDTTQINNSDHSIFQQAFINTKFTGAGPRVGLEGRRFFRNSGFSLFARTNLSLLLGQSDIDEVRFTPGETATRETNLDSHDRIIPEVDIDLGASWQMTCHLNLSAGYEWQAWWDLGMFEQGANIFAEPIDTSNILSLDGLFVRLEYTF